LQRRGPSDSSGTGFPTSEPTRLNRPVYDWWNMPKHPADQVESLNGLVDGLDRVVEMNRLLRQHLTPETTTRMHPKLVAVSAGAERRIWSDAKARAAKQVGKIGKVRLSSTEFGKAYRVTPPEASYDEMEDIRHLRAKRFDALRSFTVALAIVSQPRHFASFDDSVRSLWKLLEIREMPDSPRSTMTAGERRDAINRETMHYALMCSNLDYLDLPGNPGGWKILEGFGRQLRNLLKLAKVEPPADRGNDSRPKPKLTRLNDTDKTAGKYIRANPGCKGELVAMHANVSSEHFRSRIVPKLKEAGFTNKGSGYYPPKQSRKRAL
jgi:hypothetical protein